MEENTENGSQSALVMTTYPDKSEVIEQEPEQEENEVVAESQERLQHSADSRDSSNEVSAMLPVPYYCLYYHKFWNH